MKLSKTQQEAVANLFLLGESLREIAKKYGVNYHQVRNACIRVLGKDHYELVSAKHAKLSGDGLKLRGEKLTRKVDVRNKEIFTEYKEGVSVVEIAAKHSLSIRQIYKIVKKRNGFSVPKKERKLGYPFTYHTLDEHFMEIAEMIAKRMSVNEMSEKLGVSYHVVYRWLQQNVSEEVRKTIIH